MDRLGAGSQQIACESSAYNKRNKYEFLANLTESDNKVDSSRKHHVKVICTKTENTQSQNSRSP